MPRVLNKTRDKIPPNAVYIGRGSPNGNPFKIGVHGDRDQVCDRFESEILPTLDVSGLRGKDLVCFCAPSNCHGYSIFMKANIRDIFDYNPETGDIKWLISPSIGTKIGSIAGYVNEEGYRLIGYNNKLYKSHRLIWLYMTGNFPLHDIDHIDGNPSNNKWSNLREATESQNGANMKLPKNNTSGYKGVTWSKYAKKWQVRIKVDQKSHHLGYFDSKEEACESYNEAAKKYFGDYARVNMTEKKDNKQFEFVNSILSNKNYMDAADYSPIFGNLALSQHPDCILYVQEMNKRHNLPPQMQYDYYFYSITKMKRRFGKWAKRNTKLDDEIKLISDYFNINWKVAKQYHSLLSSEVITVMKSEMNPGGIKE